MLIMIISIVVLMLVLPMMMIITAVDMSTPAEGSACL